MSDSILEYLYAEFPLYEKQGKVAYKPGMTNSIALDNYFGSPHNNYKTIHVAGTNGKGSTSHILASVLQEQGYKVGLFTSPHLIDCNERIKINGSKISNDYILDFVTRHKSFIESLSPSFFEIITVLAFLYFADQKVDIAIIEVGLGGRLDCTNVITPILSIITNISLDHKDLLGNNLTDIAGEKAGIIKQSIPVVVGETQDEPLLVFTDKAKRGNSQLFIADQLITLQPLKQKDLQCFSVKGMGYNTIVCTDMLGEYQSKNLQTVLCSLAIVKEFLLIDEQAILDGLQHIVKNTGLQGRWQIMATHPLIICDVGHNEAGINQVMQQLEHLNYNQLHIVWGMVRDKDINSIVQLLPVYAKYYITKPNIERAMPVALIADIFEQHHLSYTSYTSVTLAFEAAKQKANDNDLIFIGGSTFVVSEIFK